MRRAGCYRGRRARGPGWPLPAAPFAPPARHAATQRRRLLGWVVVGMLVLMFGSLALASLRAPVVSAAGNPLSLHGAGTAPGCTASTLDQTVGTQATACTIQSAAGGV